MRKLVRIAKGRLEELEVERVDGVDRPATGHRWAIIKREAEEQASIEDVAKAALEAILKDEVEFSDEAIEAIKALAEMLGFDLEKGEGDEEPSEEEAEPQLDEAEPAPGDVTDPPEEPAEPVAASEGDDEELALTKSALADLIRDTIAGMIEEDEEPMPTVGRLTKSKQPEAQDEIEKGDAIRKGEGVFHNVFFGQE